MPSRTKAKPQSREPRYVPWRGELIARLALARAGLVVGDTPAPEPFDLLASTPDGFYFLVEVKAYSSMHGRNGRAVNGSREPYRWPVEGALLRAAGEVNIPVVLFVIDADREIGQYARLDRVSPSGGERTTFIPLAPDRDLSPEALAALVSELREDWAVSRRPA